MGKNGGLVDVDRVLRLFSENKALARRLYNLFVNKALREGRLEFIIKALSSRYWG